MSAPADEPTGNRAHQEEILLVGAEQTEALGRKLAARLEPGDLVLLSGEVGSGKSTLARAAMRSLGVSGPIPSPTFTIGLRYEVASSADGEGLSISHLDLYRLNGTEGEDPGLLEEYLGPETIVFAEWPGGATGWLAATAKRLIEIKIEHRDEASRQAAVRGFSL